MRESIAGSPARPFAGVDPSSNRVEISPAPGGGRICLLFLTTSCAPCQVLWNGARQAGPAHRVVVVTPGPETESRHKAAQLGGPELEVVMSSDGWIRYAVTAAPWLVIVDSGTVIHDAPAPADWDGVMAEVAR